MIIRTLRPWDGTTPESRHRYPVEKSSFPLFQDEEGNIYYKTTAGDLVPWCARCKLRAHLQRLFQLGVIWGAK